MISKDRAVGRGMVGAWRVCGQVLVINIICLAPQGKIPTDKWTSLDLKGGSTF